MKKKTATRRKKQQFEGVFEALDMMMSGNHRSVIGNDFVLTRNHDSKYGFLDPNFLPQADNDFVQELVNLRGKKIEIPAHLQTLLTIYSDQRNLLSNFHDTRHDKALEKALEASKELGNYDPIDNMALIFNEAEMNFFYDYIALYRLENNKRAMIEWNLLSPKEINTANKKVVAALEKARFSVIRLDQNLEHGAIKITNLITQKEHILIDKALNRSNKIGCFFVCSLLNMEDYVMTSGGGLPLDPKASGGSSLISFLKPFLEHLRKTAEPVDEKTIECVKKIYGTALRAGALQSLTVG